MRAGWLLTMLFVLAGCVSPMVVNHYDPSDLAADEGFVVGKVEKITVNRKELKGWDCDLGYGEDFLKKSHGDIGEEKVDIKSRSYFIFKVKQGKRTFNHIACQIGEETIMADLEIVFDDTRPPSRG